MTHSSNVALMINTLTAGTILGLSSINTGQAIPVGQIRSELPTKKINPEYIEQIKETIQNTSTPIESRRSITENTKVKKNTCVTAKQCECAERLGVDIDDCNKNGVFIKRTDEIGKEILKFVIKESWDDVTPEDLERFIHILELTNYGIRSLHDHDFDGCKNLRILWLDENQLKYLPSKAFDNLNLLLQLTVQNNKIENIGEDVFSTLKSLSVLDISGNRLRNIPDKVLNGLDKIASINLQNNQLTGLDEKSLEDIESIHPRNSTDEYYSTRLNIYGNPFVISEELFKSLRTSTPKFSIGYAQSTKNETIPNESVKIDIGDEKVYISEVKEFFENGVDVEKIHFIRPNSFILPTPPNNFTKLQETFFCKFFQAELNDTKLDQREELTKLCKSGEEDCSGIECQDIQIGIAAAAASLIIIGCVGLSVGLLVCVSKSKKKHKNENTRAGNKKINSTKIERRVNKPMIPGRPVRIIEETGGDSASSSLVYKKKKKPELPPRPAALKLAVREPGDNSNSYNISGIDLQRQAQEEADLERLSMSNESVTSSTEELEVIMEQIIRKQTQDKQNS